jgi:mRNA interferase RelE/StbE
MIDEARYRVVFARRAAKDINQPSPMLQKKLQAIVNNRLAIEPHSGKRLVGELEGYRSVRLSYKDRIVYRIDDDNQVVYIVRARTHYEMT